MSVREAKGSHGQRRTYRHNTLYDVSETAHPAQGRSAGTNTSLSGMPSRIRAAAFVASSAMSAATDYMGSSRISQARSSADHWIRSWKGSFSSEEAEKYTINIQPGWAVKRPRRLSEQSHPGSVTAFDVVLSLSGVCPAVQSNRPVSRTQKALISIAKRFAALPAILPTSGNAAQPVARSLHSSLVERTDEAFRDPAMLSDAHLNLDSRLRPFWYTVAATYPIRLSIYEHRDRGSLPSSHTTTTEVPLHEATLVTDASGHFSATIVIPWESLCTYPPLVETIFAPYNSPQRQKERQPLELKMIAQLLERPRDESPSAASGLIETPSSTIYPAERSSTDVTETSLSEQERQRPASGRKQAKLLASTDIVIQVSEAEGVRVLSDLDDTIKHSDILAGSREVFRNVFCRPLEDAVVRGMNSLYRNLADAGVDGFHYVSNSPLELLPVVKDFFRIHDFPRNFSLKLKLYGRRSLMTSLFESPGDRKRVSVVEVLDAFSNSKFILIGDSGEQDLELYLSLAQERPNQILMVIIRDVTTSHATKLRRGSLSRLPSASSLPSLNSPSLHSPSPSGSVTPDGSSREVESYLEGDQTAISSLPDSPLDNVRDTLEDLQELTTAQQKILKRAAMWDERVASAKAAIPKNIPLLLFENPAEIADRVLAVVQNHGQ